MTSRSKEDARENSVHFGSRPKVDINIFEKELEIKKMFVF
jgi:hypothetical protein